MSALALLAYLAAGATAGFLAGLLGVGGGLIIVPILVSVFAWQGVPFKHLLHLALGTSLASIVFTSLSSVRAHHAHGAVQWPVVRRMSAGLALGTLAGAGLAAQVPTFGLKVCFIVFAVVVAVQMLSGFKPKPSRTLPGTVGLNAVGALIGGVSSFVGIGGGSMSVPFLTLCNLPMPKAVGTSAALGFPIALGGLAGYALAGLQANHLPPGSFGFIYLPALACLVLSSFITAPLGACLAHRLPVTQLKKVFAGLLLVMAAKMFWGLLT
jgi:uncharacterized membrane protein YfcA